VEVTEEQINIMPSGMSIIGTDCSKATNSTYKASILLSHNSST